MGEVEKEKPRGRAKGRSSSKKSTAAPDGPSAQRGTRTRKTASKKKSTTRAGAARKKSSAKPAASRPRSRKTVTAEQRERMIAEAAYYRAEQRGFADGNPDRDWLEAEAEVDALLLGMKPPKK